VTKWVALRASAVPKLARPDASRHTRLSRGARTAQAQARRKATPETVSARLAKIDLLFADAESMARLGLLQTQLNVQRELEALEAASDRPRGN